MTKKQIILRFKAPVKQISKETTLRELTTIIQDILCAHHGEGNTLTQMSFIPVEEPCLPNIEVNLTGDQEELIILTNGDDTRNILIAALEQVRMREPDLFAEWPIKPIRITMDTTIEELFHQMVAVPQTVFSLTFLPDPDDEVDQESQYMFGMFFIRTRFTITALQSELAQLIEKEERAN